LEKCPATGNSLAAYLTPTKRCASASDILSSPEMMLALAPLSVTDGDVRRACEVTFAVILDNDVG
jgi:hypothetical protein